MWPVHTVSSKTVFVGRFECCIRQGRGWSSGKPDFWIDLVFHLIISVLVPVIWLFRFRCVVIEKQVVDYVTNLVEVRWFGGFAVVAMDIFCELSVQNSCSLYFHRLIDS